jgi:single-strand DNA-binding protein
MINKVILVGNVGRDPEMKTTGAGTRIATTSLATNERKKDQDGNWTDHTEWHRLVAWGRTAEIFEQYVQKGRQLYIEGVLRTREWEGQEGQKRKTTEIHVREMKLLGGRGGGGGGGGGAGTPQYEEPGGVAQGFPDDADDVPF